MNVFLEDPVFRAVLHASLLDHATALAFGNPEAASEIQEKGRDLLQEHLALVLLSVRDASSFALLARALQLVRECPG